MMERVLEPELMNEEEQVRAYAKADFSKENQAFVDLFCETFPDVAKGHILDAGCGPGDIPIRLLRTFPDCRITAVDGASNMIRLAEEAARQSGCGQAIEFHCSQIQDWKVPEPVDAVISNSLVHHLPNPLVFWNLLKTWLKPGGAVLVMDLLRPASPDGAKSIVERYAADEASILKRDFFHSLLAALTEDEVAAHLAQLNLSRLCVDVLDDRHWIVCGRVS